MKEIPCGCDWSVYDKWNIKNESSANLRMACAQKSDEENPSDVSDEWHSDGHSEGETDLQFHDAVPCKFYNSGGCQDGNRCLYLHMCKYALKGNCRYGSKCKLNHNVDGMVSFRANRPVDQPQHDDPKLTDGRLYQWQLNDGSTWTDVDNDHVIEAHYSLPRTKSMTIYNTPYGTVSIDFNRMRVNGKNLRVRRLDDGNAVWIWYCTVRRKWIKYGDKDSKGNCSAVKSSDIEMQFQRNPTSSYTFNVGAESVEIRFREMRQVGKNKKRKVTRRPLFRQKQMGASSSRASAAFQRLSLGAKPRWEFQGDSGEWHAYKRRKGTPTECTVKSEDIEREYQRNAAGSMLFQVMGRQYRLDFGAMTQTNCGTRHSRKVRRVLV